MTSPFTLYSTLFSGLITENKVFLQLVEHENDPKYNLWSKYSRIIFMPTFIGALICTGKSFRI